jgi:hypothetical protein
MNKLLVQALMMLGGTLRGTVGGALDYLNTLLKSGLTTATKFHQEGIAFARELGMNAKEAQAYTQVLTNRTEKLAATYGVAAEQIKAIQRGISESTSRQLILNDAQAEQFLQLNKLVGSSVTSKFTEEIMQGMGGQLETVQGAVAKAYATAAKSGLSAQKVSEKIAANLNMANKLSFRTGIDGLTRMAMQAEKVGMSLQSVEAVANNFLEIDDAISHAAQLQMLGGSAGAFGGNPMDMLYEANYDPEALQKRMTSMLGGYAQFDAKTGMASINGANQDFIRNIAKAMGIDTAEASRIAKKNAEVKFKESNINFGAYGNLTQEQKDFLINKSNVANGRTTFTTQDGKTIDLTSGQALDQKVLQEMMKYEGMSDSDIMKENARSLTSIDEKLKGIGESISAMFAKFLEGLFPEAVKDLDNIGAFAKAKLEPIAKNIGVAARGVYDWFKENKETIKTIASGVLGFIKFATEHWKILLTTLGTLKFLKFLGNAGILGKGSTASSAARIGGNIFSRMHKGSAHEIFSNTFQGMGRLRNQSWWSRTRTGAKLAWKGTSSLAKGTAALGALTGVIQGIGAISEYSKKKEEINNSNMSAAEKEKAIEAIRIDKNSEVGGAVGAGVGTVLGTFFFGPLGGMIGGAVGEFAGKFIGQYWDPIVNNVTSLFKKIGDGVVWLANKSLDAIKWLVDNNPLGLMVKGIGKIVGKDWSITGAISSVFGGGEKHADGGIVGGSSYSGDKVLTRLNSGEMVLNFDQQNRLFNAIKNLSTPIIPSISNVTNNRNANSRHTIQTREVTIQNIGGNKVNTFANNSKFSSVLNDTSNVQNRWNRMYHVGGNSSVLNDTSNIQNRWNRMYHVGGNVQPTSINNFGDYSLIDNRISNRVKGVAPVPTKIEAKPVGEKEYIYTPKRTETSTVNGGTVTVKDFNININGTLKLDGGNSFKNINMNELLNNPQFVSAIKQMVQERINSDFNGGRFDNSPSVMRGLTTQVNTYGKKA